jgi:hypothetical protein
MLFRARSLADATDLFARSLQFGSGLSSLTIGIGRANFALALILVAALIVVDLFQQRYSIRGWLFRLHPAPRWALAFLLVLSIEALGVYDHAAAFLYVRF